MGAHVIFYKQGWKGEKHAIRRRWNGKNYIEADDFFDAFRCYGYHDVELFSEAECKDFLSKTPHKIYRPDDLERFWKEHPNGVIVVD